MSTQIRAREYLRRSKKESGRIASIDEQHSENKIEADEQGWLLGKPYRDNESASRYARAARKGYDQLISDLESDAFDAEILIIWESSRGSRRTGEWVLLIELCEERGVKIHVTTHQRTYKPGNGRDRKSLIEDAAASEYESSLISDRTRRSSAARAAQGRPHGRPPLGYVRTYDSATGKLTGQQPDPETAPMIRELFERLQQGHSFHGIARDLEGRGIRNASGKPYSPPHLRSLACMHAYAGLRVHDKKRVSSNTPSPSAKITEGTWEPLISKELFWSVQSILAAPERLTARPGRAKHLLSMITRCGVCSGPIGASNRRDHWEYGCRDKGHVRIRKDDLDELGTELILEYLGDKGTAERLAAKDVDGEQLRRVRDEIAELRQRLDGITDAVVSGEMSAGMGGRAEERVQAALTAAQDRERELATPGPLRGLLGDGPVRKRWEQAPMSTRREIARYVLAPGRVGVLHVTRSPIVGRRAADVRDRVEFREAGWTTAA